MMWMLAGAPQPETDPGTDAGAGAAGKPPVGARPTVAVVVPVHNGERFLTEMLESVFAQTYQPVEIIVMDDASTDATPEILEGYAGRLRHVRQAANRGQFLNVNDGIQMAEADVIGVFHADDVYEPQMIEREVAWLVAHPAAGAVFCSDVFVDDRGCEFGRLSLPPEIRGEMPLDYSTILNALLRHGNTFLRCPTALVRAEVYRDVGLYRPDRYANTSDLDMWLRIARRHRIGVLEGHYLRYRRGHGSSSERYQHLRTEPSRVFTILDGELQHQGAGVATTTALAAYEGRRSVDHALCAASKYILGDIAGSRAALRSVKALSLARTGSVQRVRMIALTVALRLLARLPRSGRIAALFERRWYPTPPGGG
jgi:glycosyltransferase involved in cell wall biosynthesis